MVDERLEEKLDEISDEPPRRGIIKNLLKYVTGRFYENSSTYEPKEQDSDYESRENYGTEYLG